MGARKEPLVNVGVNNQNTISNNSQEHTLSKNQYLPQNSQYSSDYHSNFMLANLSQNSKHGQTNYNPNAQQTGCLNQQQNSTHCYNWGAFAAHSALAAVGYNAPTLMQGNTQNVPTNSASQQHQTASSPQSTNTSQIPYHQFASRNLPLTGYDYNYRPGGYL